MVRKGKKHNSHRHSHYNKRKEHSDYYHCSFCGKYDSLPFKCKYCGRVHCGDHRLPEDHGCEGLHKPKSWLVSRRENIREKRERFIEKRQTNNWNEPREHKKRFRFHSPKLPKIRLSKFFTALIIAMASYFLATYFLGNNIFLWIEAGAWIYFSFILYKKAFRWANRVNMADDLAFFGLRILGGIIVFIGVYIMFATLFASLFVRNSAPMSIPLFCLLGGLIFLGGFIAFRTNRRHNVVGFWRA